MRKSIGPAPVLLVALLLALPAGAGEAQDFQGSSSRRAYDWVPSEEGQPVPRDAVRGGRERQDTLYVCRAAYQGGLHPGKLLAGKCLIGYGGKEVGLSRYEVLVGAREGMWAPPGRNFEGALEGGREDGRVLLLCRADYSGALHPGKVVSGVCNFGYGGKEVSAREFEVFYLTPPRQDYAPMPREEYREPEPQRREAPFTICADQPLPRGTVILQGGRDMKCANWSPTTWNTFTVKRPEEEEEICSVSPLPRGYRVVSESTRWECPGWEPGRKNSQKIRRY